jgi:hypothetical protein
MSAIVIHWVHKTADYEHTALLLNNLGGNQSLYISIYRPLNKDRATNRFASQTLENDTDKHNIADYVVIPTCEDGNKFGLSEGLIAKFWMELFNFKKIPHEQFIAELSAQDAKTLSLQDEDKASSSSENEHQNEAPSAKTKLALLHRGKQNALNELSNEFEKFSSHSLFSKQPILDCTKFIAKLLQKGGLDLFLEPKLLDGYIGVTQFIHLAKQAKKNIFDVQDQPTMIKDPELTISKNTPTWSDRQMFRH